MENIIVAFHTGRGGRFYNPGYITFIGEKVINEFTDDLFVVPKNQNEILSILGKRENLIELYYNAIICDQCCNKFEKRTNIKIEEDIYVDLNGSPVGLSVEEAKSGVGVINIDNEYDTTTCLYLKNCSERELKIIVESDYWNGHIIDYAKQKLINAL